MERSGRRQSTPGTKGRRKTQDIASPSGSPESELTSTDQAGGAAHASEQAGATPASDVNGSRNAETLIREQAYLLFEAAGREHGHDLDHWLEAERQVSGSSERRSA